MADAQHYGSRLIEALGVAARLHARQLRKGSEIPYLSHLLGTCALALEYGADEDEAIAALLHDAIEDVEPVEEVRVAVAAFGERVLHIVEGCTDTDLHPKPPWRERKEAYVAHIREADASVLLVSAADKLHNARSVVADLRRHGSGTWDRFTGGRDGSLWYYRAMVSAFRANPEHPRDLVDELDRVVCEMEELAA
ncbi:MAG TPA: HD domain-containing protein [Candidatus Limnocylindria bacterium]|jgi:(p)ppGpp synthase/HD superfamily hydrolase|nr:HD domain-containing protein [Candidatus Limnocylindria bacterium]